MNPIYTKEVKETQVHFLGSINLGTVNLVASQLEGQGLGERQIEGVLNPIYTKEVKETQGYI